MECRGSSSDYHREFCRYFYLLRIDQVYDSTAPWFTSSCSSLPYAREPHVSLMQDLCRHEEPKPLYPHRSRESYSWYVVSCRGVESYRERVRGVKHSRSMALGGNNRRTVQRVRQHVFKDQTGSQRLPIELCNGRTETTLYR